MKQLLIGFYEQFPLILEQLLSNTVARFKDYVGENLIELRSLNAYKMWVEEHQKCMEWINYIEKNYNQHLEEDQMIMLQSLLQTNVPKASEPKRKSELDGNQPVKRNKSTVAQKLP